MSETSPIRKIGVLTSGGDAPGMNAAIRAVIRTAMNEKLLAVGIYHGYKGLINKEFTPMFGYSVADIIHRGGTILKTSRCPEFKTDEGIDQAYQNLIDEGIDGLVVIGGDGTFRGALALHKRHPDIRIVGLPGTIDNDLYGTDYTIGYDTAINTVVQAVDKIRDTAGSHGTLFFVEVMGRDAGFIALNSGIATGAEDILIPETETKIDSLIEKLKYDAEHQLESARKQRDALIKQGETELEAARLKARTMTQEVQSSAYALMDEMRKLQKDEKASAAQKAQRAREIARKDTEKLFGKTDVVHNVVKEFTPLKSVKVGQEVCIAELDQLATVTSLPDRHGMVGVRAGIMRTKVPLSGLCAPNKMQKAPQPKKQPGRSTTVQRSESSRDARMEINLLGMTVEEALMETDQFIDHAVLNNITTIYLIHGKGTGALRSAIQAHLRGHKNVKSFRLGRYGEGEAGVTVVELK